jgi:peptidoglycan hydrolase-like protein with peptidoglycan-binding domain
MNRRTAIPAAALLVLLWAFGPVPHQLWAQLSASGSSSGSSASKSTSASKKMKKPSHRHSSRREPFQKAPTPDRISEIQSALARGGYYQGDPNGKWDSNTVSALQKFQSANNLNASGKLDATSLQKMGLGSSTAGLNPPTPPVRNSTSSTAPTASTSASTGSTQSGTVNSASNSAPTQPRR